MRKSPQLYYTLPESLAQQVKDLAHKRHTTLSQVTRDAVAAYLTLFAQEAP
jgi:predicted transcriptional regulator